MERKREASRSKYNKFKISSRSHHEIGNLSLAGVAGVSIVCVQNWTPPKHFTFMPICSAFSSLSFSICISLFLPTAVVQLFCSPPLLSALTHFSPLFFNCLFTLELPPSLLQLVVALGTLSLFLALWQKLIIAAAAQSSNAEAARVISCRSYERQRRTL